MDPHSQSKQTALINSVFFILKEGSAIEDVERNTGKWLLASVPSVLSGMEWIAFRYLPKDNYHRNPRDIRALRKRFSPIECSHKLLIEGPHAPLSNAPHHSWHTYKTIKNQNEVRVMFLSLSRLFFAIAASFRLH